MVDFPLRLDRPRGGARGADCVEDHGGSGVELGEEGGPLGGVGFEEGFEFGVGEGGGGGRGGGVGCGGVGGSSSFGRRRRLTRFRQSSRYSFDGSENSTIFLEQSTENMASNCAGAAEYGCCGHGGVESASLKFGSEIKLIV